VDPYSFVLSFPGTDIGKAGLDGPFTVRDLVIVGTGGFANSGSAGMTPAFEAAMNR
jgi:hypothetical protein